MTVDGDAGLSNGLDGNLVGSNGLPFNATRFMLKTHAGRSLILDIASGLVSETDPNGNTLAVDANGLHASTRPVDHLHPRQHWPDHPHQRPFRRSPELRLFASRRSRVIDQPGGQRNLLRLWQQPQSTSTNGPGGQALQRLTYDADGRLTGVTDAAGNVTHITNDVAGRRQVVSSPSGRLTTIYAFDDLGDLVRQDEVFDGQTLTTSMTYDAVGRPLQVVDPLGRTTSAS